MSSKLTFTDLYPLYKNYYDNVYPAEMIYRWVTYGKCPVNISSREWSWKFITEDTEDVTRNRRINSAEEFRDLIKMKPGNMYETIITKFDVGSFYKYEVVRPKLVNGVTVTKPNFPVARELVFDFDIPDFDSIRECPNKHTGAILCNKCWSLIEAAIPIVLLFCNTYNFNHYMFVFSGNKGCHCWVCDKEAMLLDSQERMQLLEPFYIIKNETKAKIEMTFNYNSNPLHRLIADEISAKVFNKLIEDGSEIWLTGSLPKYRDQPLISQQAKKYLDGLMDPSINPDENQPIQKFLRKVVLLYEDNVKLEMLKYANDGIDVTTQQSKTNSHLIEVGNVLDVLFKDCLSEFVLEMYKSSEKRSQADIWRIFQSKFAKFELIPVTVMVYFTYPRFDMEVTRNMKHLLKVPFSPHEKSGLISLPFAPDQVLKRFQISDNIIKTNTLPEFIESKSLQFSPETAISLKGIKANPDLMKPIEEFFIKNFVDRIGDYINKEYTEYED